jgi:hypothetical protein
VLARGQEESPVAGDEVYLEEAKHWRHNPKGISKK